MRLLVGTVLCYMLITVYGCGSGEQWRHYGEYHDFFPPPANGKIDDHAPPGKTRNDVFVDTYLMVDPDAKGKTIIGFWRKDVSQANHSMALAELAAGDTAGISIKTVKTHYNVDCEAEEYNHDQREWYNEKDELIDSYSFENDRWTPMKWADNWYRLDVILEEICEDYDETENS